MTDAASIHINSIIKLRDDLNFELFKNNNYRLAISQMIGIMGLLKPKDQDDVLLKSLQDEEEAILIERSTIKLQKRMMNRRKTYQKWYFEINKILWDNKYLEEEGYSLIYPSELPSENRYNSPLLRRP